MTQRVNNDPLVLWTSAGTAAITLATTENRWFLNDNTLSANSSAPPATTVWFKIPLQGADYLTIQGGFKVVGTPAGGGTCSVSSLLGLAFLQPYVDPNTDFLAAPGVTLAAYTLALTSTLGSGNAALLVAGGTAAGGVIQQLQLGATILADGVPLIADTTAVAAGDITSFFVRVGAPTLGAAGTVASIVSTTPVPCVTGFDAAYVAFKFSPTLSASITTFQLSGQILANRHIATPRTW